MQIKQVSALIICFFILLSCGKEQDSSTAETTKSGSYATMLTIAQKLYLVNKTQITTFDVKDPKNPVELNKQEAGFDIESLYHHNGLLIIGSANNMYIYRIGADGIPVRESTTTYNETFGSDICTRDPIVVNENIAYVTLSTTTQICRGFLGINQLRVYNIQNIKSPKLLSTINMSAPKGLGIGKNHLFVCDATDGLVVFKIDDPINPVKVKSFGGFEGFDLIVNGNLLIVAAKKQLIQYDISNESDIKYLGKIDL